MIVTVDCHLHVPEQDERCPISPGLVLHDGIDVANGRRKSSSAFSDSEECPMGPDTSSSAPHCATRSSVDGSLLPLDVRETLS